MVIHGESLRQLNNYIKMDNDDDDDDVCLSGTAAALTRRQTVTSN